MSSSLDIRTSAASSSEPTAAPGAVLISCRGVDKKYFYYTHRSRTLREWFIRRFRGGSGQAVTPEFALKGLDLEIRKGEIVALLGPNGSGKSTALRMMAGIYTPTAGEIDVIGRVAAVMELGAGFHEDLTGAENVALYAAVMGMTPGELDERYESILAFADIGAFVDTPVRYYSSGMQARLAFAVAMNVRPDIVLLDEVMAVGDESFRDRCVEALDGFVAGGGTIVVVSHDLAAVEQFCHRAVWIERGVVRDDGPASEVVPRYRAASHAAGRPQD
ncbi:ABC transporter ATP-binding protein [bacterium]|nr:ABC transporter ATP-binding protein [bacterium]